MKNALEKIREISNTKKINKWLIVVIVILLFGLIGFSPSPETDKKTAEQKYNAMASEVSDENKKEDEKQKKEKEQQKEKQKTNCIVAAKQEVNTYISGAHYPWSDDDYYIYKKTNDSGAELWTISTTISIENVVEKQPIKVIITIVDDNHYQVHYVSVGNYVYFDDGTTD